MTAPSHPSPEASTRLLLDRMGLPDLWSSAALRFTGEDPVVASPNAYGTATASALGAFSLAVAELWRMRTGQRQDIEIDLRRAVACGLRSVFLLRQSGHGFTVGGNGQKIDNFYPTADGRRIYLLRMYDYPHLVPALLGVLRCPNDRDAIAEVASRWNAVELEEALAAARAIGVVSRTPEEWLAHPQGAWLAQRPGFEIQKIGDSQAEPLPEGDRPLAGLRVLDASHVIAGPATGRTLAEHGAEVLRVSAPHQPDSQQMVIDLGFGKRSAFIDLEQVEDARQLRELARSADIFIESWRPGAMERRKFSPRDLAALRPGIIYVSLSCYGNGGPWRERAGYEPIGQAACGLATREGTPQAPRLAPTTTMNDYLAAYLAAAGTAAALVRRARDGGSYHVTTSLTQSSMWVLQQGQVPADALAGAPGLGAPLPDDWMARTASPFGLLDHTAPVAQLSRTPGFWARPPEPLGTSAPTWLTA